MNLSHYKFVHQGFPYELLWEGRWTFIVTRQRPDACDQCFWYRM